LSEKIGSMDCRPGRKMQAKKRIPPLVTSTPENPEPKTKKISISTRRLTESVGGLNSFLAQMAGEL